MAARLSLPRLLLIAAFATFLLSFETGRWIRNPKVTPRIVAFSAACCIGMVFVGDVQYQHWNARQMLITHSFTWTGIAIGLLPSRKTVIEWRDEWRPGARRKKYVHPARCQAAVYVSGIVMLFLGACSQLEHL